MSNAQKDHEVENALQHYLQMGTVSDAIEQIRLGIPLDEETCISLKNMGLDPELLDEEFADG